MKLTAVLVVLAVLSGCHGRSVPADDRAPQWETAANTFLHYFKDASTAAEVLVKEIRNSHVSKELDKLIQDVTSEWSIYQDSVKNNVAPFAQDVAQRAGQDLQLQADKLRADMVEAQERVAQYAQELHTMVEQNADDVAARMNAYARKLRKRLNKDKQELNAKVASYLEELQSRTSDNVESIKSRVEPYIAQVRDNTQTKISALDQMLQSQVEAVGDLLQSTAETIQGQLGRKVENLRTTLEDKVEEIRDWIKSYTGILGDSL